jgi:hypothetical protein
MALKEAVRKADVVLECTDAKMLKRRWPEEVVLHCRQSSSSSIPSPSPDTIEDEEADAACTRRVKGTSQLESLDYTAGKEHF